MDQKTRTQNKITSEQKQSQNKNGFPFPHLIHTNLHTPSFSPPPTITPLPFTAAPTVWRVIRSHSYSSYECKIITTANQNILAFFPPVLCIHKFPQIFNRDDPLIHGCLHSLRKYDQLLFSSHWCVSRAPLGCKLIQIQIQPSILPCTQEDPFFFPHMKSLMNTKTSLKPVSSFHYKEVAAVFKVRKFLLLLKIYI